jgi:hypothetical protein
LERGRAIIEEQVEHHNAERAHRVLVGEGPVPRAIELGNEKEVVDWPHLREFDHSYRRVA